MNTIISVCSSVVLTALLASFANAAPLSGGGQDDLFSPPPPPGAILGGDEGEACKMLVCLSSALGQDIKECDKALRDYAKMKPHKRPGYLEKCPKQK